MGNWLSTTWPWYIAGPIIGLFVPALLLVGNKVFGISGNLSHMCSALLPRKPEYLRYNWKDVGLWNLVFLAGVLVGGFLAAHIGQPHDVAISPATQAALTRLGLHNFSGVAPHEIFSWHAILGTAYAGGCTSGHAISGLANFQLPSLIAVIGFFAGGLTATWFILPFVIGAL